MGNDIAHIQGDLKALSKDISNVEIITSSNWNDLAKLIFYPFLRPKVFLNSHISLNARLFSEI